ncbi:MAG: DUF4286 family protein [Ignavibacteriaceae bacterium]|jgi:hypothetical protein|nr:DUF4286 family protein [Ignavibacteriaceae bacterium]MCU0413829.1 DUF4286 family protein [Ignavibacteriaceae bacterium]
MIIYSVTVIIKKDVEDLWLKWMKEIHIPDVMKTGYFLDWKLRKLLSPEFSGEELTYVIEYTLRSLEKYNEYSEKAAAQLQKEHTKKFSGKFKATRAVYQLVLQ